MRYRWMIVFLLFANVGFAQDSAKSAGAGGTSDQTALVQELISRVEKLERRIQELESDKKSPPPTASANEATVEP